MSMPVSFFALGPKQLERYVAAIKRQHEQLANDSAKPMAFKDDPNDWGDVLTKKPGEEDPEEILENAKVKLDIDWQHFGLAYLMMNAVGQPYQTADLPNEVFGRNLGIGNNEYGGINDTAILQPDEVRCGLDYLASFEVNQLRAKYTPKAMEALDIFPTTAWTEAQTIDCLVDTFESLKKLFSKAAKKDLSLVVKIAI